MPTYADLVSLVSCGKRPVVTFLGAVEEFETYAEEGMRARIVGAQLDHDLVRVTFAFDEFEAHNRTYEKANYFAKYGGPTVTAREAGRYRPEEDIYCEPGEATRIMRFDSDAALDLYNEYKTAQAAGEGADTSYTQWLEEQVLALRQAPAGDRSARS